MQLPLNVSPVSASFFGLQRLGIHLVLSLACALLAWLFSLPFTRPVLPTYSHSSIQKHAHSRSSASLSLLALAILK
jgi:hypothetical protein